MASNEQRQGRQTRMREKLQWQTPSGFSRHRVWADPDDHGTGVLHEQRLQFVREFVQHRPEHSRRIGDLGCGAGALVQCLLGLPNTAFVLGLDVSAQALLRVRQHPSCAQAIASGRLQLQVGSFLQVDLHLWQLDTLVLLETIEHIPPERLDVLGRQLFGQSDARQILVSTPNADYNPLLGLPPGKLRHPDHQFEWGRSRFQDWVQRLAHRYGYEVMVKDIGSPHATAGSPSQIAVFIRPSCAIRPAGLSPTGT